MRSSQRVYQFAQIRLVTNDKNNIATGTKYLRLEVPETRTAGQRFADPELRFFSQFSGGQTRGLKGSRQRAGQNDFDTGSDALEKSSGSPCLIAPLRGQFPQVVVRTG
jgi:hypothetical protein